MLNFIIYEDEVTTKNQLTKTIINFIGSKKEIYKIYTFDKYNAQTEKTLKEVIGKKIFLFDIETDNAINFAKSVRNSGDWLSPIIMIINNRRTIKTLLNNKLLMLDFIIKDSNMEENIKKALFISYKIIKTHKSFQFQIDGEIYNIPYHDILFFEKDLNHNYTKVVTEKQIYKTKKSLTKIEKDLESDLRFFKCHRSYIINLHNIDKIDLNLNMIEFKEKKKAMISRNRKKILKEMLENIGMT